MKWMWEHKRLIALVLVVGLLIWRVGKNSKTQERKNSKTTMVRVEKRDVVQSVMAAGKIEAQKQAILNFPSAGKLGYINVEVGDRVRKWQALAGLDLRDAQAAQVEAYYKYIAADANAKLIEDQVKGHDSDESLTQKNTRVAAQTARDAAYEVWQQAARAVRNANLISPLDGVVTNVTATVLGDTVGTTDGVTVVDPDSLYFATEVDETDVGKVAVGLPVKVALDAYAGREFTGEITEIGFVAELSDTGATVFKIRTKILRDEEIKLRVGMNGDATMILKQAKDVPALPVESVKDGKVTSESGKKTEVQTGLVGDSYVEITGGVSEGENVQRYPSN